MQIREVLQKKGTEVFTAEPDETVASVVDRLNERRVGALMVVGPSGQIAGIITERDVLRNYRDCVAASVERPVRVSDIMSTELVIGVPEDEIEYAMTVMTRQRVRHLPILEGGRLAGIISIGDIVKAQLAAFEYENRLLKDYIQQG